MARNQTERRSSWFDNADPSDGADYETVTVADEDMPERVIAHEPPIASVIAPDITDRLPTLEVKDIRPIAVVGAHGGAGATTLAAIEPDLLFDVGMAWPAAQQKQACVVVARTSARGLYAAQTALQQWAAAETPSVDLLGLVLIADAPGRLPKPLRELSQIVAGGAPRTWRLPWDAALRLDADNTGSTRRSHRLIRNLKTLVKDQ